MTPTAAATEEATGVGANRNGGHHIGTVGVSDSAPGGSKTIYRHPHGAGSSFMENERPLQVSAFFRILLPNFPNLIAVFHPGRRLESSRLPWNNRFLTSQFQSLEQFNDTAVWFVICVTFAAAASSNTINPRNNRI